MKMSFPGENIYCKNIMFLEARFLEGQVFKDKDTCNKKYNITELKFCKINK